MLDDKKDAMITILFFAHSFGESLLDSFIYAYQLYYDQMTDEIREFLGDLIAQYIVNDIKLQGV